MLTLITEYDSSYLIVLFNSWNRMFLLEFFAEADKTKKYSSYVCVFDTKFIDPD